MFTIRLIQNLPTSNSCHWFQFCLLESYLKNLIILPPIQIYSIEIHAIQIYDTHAHKIDCNFLSPSYLQAEHSQSFFYEKSPNSPMLNSS